MATCNDVVDGIIQTPGKLISREDIENAIKPMEKKTKVNLYEKVNSRALYIKDDAIIWWTPSLKRTYKCGKKRSMYEWPSMVFVRTERDLHVYAYIGNEAPNEDTTLYNPALQSVWDAKGFVHCCGLSVPPPRMHLLEEIEDAFFFSPFTEMPSPTMREVCKLGDLANEH